MWTSTEDCFCHEQVRQSLRPNSSYDQRRTSSADMASKSAPSQRSCSAVSTRWSGASRGGSSGSGRLALTEQHLVDRVGTEPQPERLERDHFLGRDVAQVHVASELLHEPGLPRLP